MTNNFETKVAEIRKCVEMGIFSKEKGAELIEEIVKKSLTQPEVSTPEVNKGGNKQGTGAKGGRKRLTDEEKKAKKEADKEAWRASKKAYGKEHYTDEERKAYGEKKQADRELGKKKNLAYCMTNVFFANKKVSSKEWHEKYDEILATL
jgi:hypothetical protein